MSPEEFDKAYLAWLEKRVGQTAANFDAWAKGLKELAALAKANDERCCGEGGSGGGAAVSGVCGGCECV